MSTEVTELHARPRTLQKRILATTRDHPDSFAPAALGGLDGKAVEFCEFAQRVIHLVLLIHGKAQTGHGNTILLSDQFRAQFVVYQGKTRSWIVAPDKIEVAGIHTQHAPRSQLSRP